MKRTDIKRLLLADTVLAALEPEQKDYYQNYGLTASDCRKEGTT
ncbi:hypothetical protein SOM46_04315 [Pseudomonas fluorescens]|nr:hypothetical protein [Pseudomonas fluorescens]MDY0894179.1 hypothetical protein [Pseudomonas fluorescens]